MRSTYKGRNYCEKHFYDEYEKDYVCSATSDQISKFLVRMGSKSIYWKHASEQQKLEALEYYKIHGRVEHDPSRL